MEGRRPRVLLGVCGSVAAVKACELASRLLEECVMDVRVVWTGGGRYFLERVSKDYNEESFQNYSHLIESEEVGSYYDADEWHYRSVSGDPVVHIELRKWADVLLIAPLSANTLGKLANGMCDNLLTCVARAWDVQKPFIVAPAMNTHMWNHPFTEKQLQTLKDLGVIVIDPVEKTLACGDSGTGALAGTDTILEATKSVFHKEINPHYPVEKVLDVHDARADAAELAQIFNMMGRFGEVRKDEDGNIGLTPNTALHRSFTFVKDPNETGKVLVRDNSDGSIHPDPLQIYVDNATTAICGCIIQGKDYRILNLPRSQTQHPKNVD